MRLDIFLSNQYNISRSKAQDLIKSGKVKVNDITITKTGYKTEGDVVDLIEEEIYVGRAAHKLKYAIEKFNIDINSKTALDIGSSTGGFTQILLKYGAKSIDCVDVGSDQLDNSLRNNRKIRVFENTDIREFVNNGYKYDVVTVDVSFISILKILSSIKSSVYNGSSLIALIKPQFEVGEENIGKSGVVKDNILREKILENIILEFKREGFQMIDYDKSPILGKAGNIEYLVYFKYMED